MNRYKRPYIQQLINFWKAPGNLLTVLQGARRVGKTTMVLQALDDYGREYGKYIALDEPRLPHETIASDEPQLPREGLKFDANSPVNYLISEWDNAREKARKLAKERKSENRSRKNFVLILDEIQKVPDWSGVVKGLWDADHREGLNLHVTVLGSAPLLLQAGLSESLVGRFQKMNLPHWSYGEMADAFSWSLNDYLFFGGYPSIADGMKHQENPHEWQDYVRTSMVEPYIETDVKGIMPGLRKPALLKNLVVLGSQYAAQILSYNKMLGQLQDAGNTTTLAHYLELLEKVNMLVGLSNFSGGNITRNKSNPKLLTLNNALMGAYCDYTTQEEAIADRTFRGRLAENAVGAHLYQTKHDSGAKLYYWRQKDDEVDYVVHWHNIVFAIEVKSGNKKASGNGFTQFHECYRKHERVKKIKNIIIDDKDGGEDLTLAEFLFRPANEWLKEWRDE